MKQYYTANINGLKIKSLEPNKENIQRISFESIIIKKDVIYYRARAGRLIEANNGYPTNTLYEAEDWLEDLAKKKYYNEELLKQQIVRYIDENSLKPIEVTKEQEKILKKERKSRK